MARQFTNIAFTPGVKNPQTRYGSREIYDQFAKRGISTDTLTAYSVFHSDEVHIIFPLFPLLSSLFYLPSSIFPVPCSLFPVP
ncbi:hypothetical protein [Moorena producens]|uniref:hypothetical protein n=1 Tax=Moorena producens TaxID=1155739 RepID=UPI003C79273B